MKTPRILLVPLALTLLSTLAPAQEDEWAFALGAGEENLLGGDLRRAATQFRNVLEAALDPEEPAETKPRPEQVLHARVGLWRIDLRQGRYEGILVGYEDRYFEFGPYAGIDSLPAESRKLPAVASLRAQALARMGRYEDAIAELEPQVAAQPFDMELSYHLGDLQMEIGRKEEARATWQGAVDRAEATPVRDAVNLAWLGRCLVALGGRSRIERGSQYLVDSMRLDPDRPEARTTRGILRFQAYGEAMGFDSGESDLKEVLERNGEVEEALLALYRLRRSNFQLDPGTTQDYLNRVLDLNPNSVPALVERAAVLVDDRRFDEGGEVLDQALEINPRDKQALAHRAAVSYLTHDLEEYRDLREQALAVDPTFVEVDRILGDHLVSLYRFADAIPFYQAVLDAEAEDVPSLHGMAKALIYTGRGEAAVELLERAQTLQPGFVNPWRRNALAVEELLRTEYATVDSEGFTFRFPEDEQGVLSAYLVPLEEEARRVLGERYGLIPEDRVRVEVFRTWDDFSVRTIGFRGFTALGACFGPFLTMVSPGDGDLRRQDFMWAATAWHEYAHVLTLGLSRHRVPRWLTEGISVYEEHARDPAWERGMKRELFDAFHNREIVPVRLLNGLFRGPKILFGYYQGGLIAEYITDTRGFDKVVEMLKLYGEDRSTEEIFREALGISTTAFDAELLEFIDNEKLAGMKLVPRLTDASINRVLARISGNPDDLEARVLLGWAFAHRNNPVDAGIQIREVLTRDPDNGPALLLHAELLRQREAFDEAVAAYRQAFATGAEDFDSRIRYGRLLEAREDLEGAMDQYQRAKGCWPDCTDQTVAPSLQLSRVLTALDRNTEAMMELKTFCSRTARAFAPRLQLAAYEQAQGDRRLEAQYLEEAVRIDPFMRTLHLRLADAYQAIDRQTDAIRELEVALVVPPSKDRAYLAEPGSAPEPDSEPERLSRAGINLSLARLYHGQGDNEKAFARLDTVEELAPGSEAAAAAKSLREDWR